MRNVLRVFARDLKRIAKAPSVLSVLLFLILLPSLYSWFNVAGFWNPYDNTQNMRICVVNQDKGADNDIMGHLDLGQQIVEQLAQNTQLGWAFMDFDDAIEEVESGSAYATFAIPESFSSDVASILSDDFKKPQLQYYVNEKLNPVSPKVVDTGASTLENTINSMFVGTVSQTVAETLNSTLGLVDGKVSAVGSEIAGKLGDASGKLGSARSAIADLKLTVASAAGKASLARCSLSSAKEQVDAMSASLQDTSNISKLLGESLSRLSGNLGTGMSKALTDVSKASSTVNTVVGKVSGTIAGAQGTVDGAVGYAQALVDANSAAISKLEGLAPYIPEESRQLYEDTVSSLKAANAGSQTTIDGLKTFSADMADGADKVSKSSDEANEAVQQAITAAGTFNEQVSGSTFPTIISGISSISASCGELGASISNQSYLIDQTSSVLRQLEDLFRTSIDALSQTDAFIAQIQGELETVRTDVTSLETSQALFGIMGDDGKVDPDKIADFMTSPTQVDTERLYPLEAYGCGMAPLFINLTLWIGAFMLMVIIRLEVDEEGLEDVTVTQRFFGRGILLAILSTLQAVVCVAGCLVLGVQTASTPVFFLTAIFCSLTYLAIQYSLSTTFQHVGMGLCIILVFMQIPAATGLYPVELTARFFQIVYPMFPFTYGINAMREAICGFYGTAWWGYIGVLAMFMAAFVAIGVFVRPLLTNANLMFVRQLEESDIVNCESVHLPMRRFKFVQLFRDLYGHNEFRKPIEERARKFMRLYPRLKVGAVVVGIVAPIAFTAVFALTVGEKVVILAAWLVWLLMTMVFLIVIESIRDSLARRTIMGRMQDTELDGLFMGLRERRRRRRAGGGGAADSAADAEDAEDAALAGDADSAGKEADDE